MVVERIVYISKIEKFYILSILKMLVLVINIM